MKIFGIFHFMSMSPFDRTFILLIIAK